MLKSCVFKYFLNGIKWVNIHVEKKKINRSPLPFQPGFTIPREFSGNKIWSYIRVLQKYSLSQNFQHFLRVLYHGLHIKLYFPRGSSSVSFAQGSTLIGFEGLLAWISHTSTTIRLSRLVSQLLPTKICVILEEYRTPLEVVKACPTQVLEAFPSELSGEVADREELKVSPWNSAKSD